MRSLLKYIISNPLIVALCLVVLILLGLYAATQMPVALFPNLDVPLVNIITHYPGATPEDIEALITRPIEDEMCGIPGVRRVSSVSAPGIAQITVEFNWGISVRQARQITQTHLARVHNVLPTGIEPRLENIGTTLQEVAGYVVYGSTDLVTMHHIVRYRLTSKLMSLRGVAGIEVLGGDEPAFVVVVSPRALYNCHLTLNNIIQTIRKSNASVVAGYSQRSGREYVIRGDARLTGINDIRRLPIPLENGQPVFLGNIARVQRGKLPHHYVVRGNRLPAVAFVVRKLPGVNTVSLVKAVDKTLMHFPFPTGTYVKKYYDQSEIITEARDTIFQDATIGAGLAVLMLFFFLGTLRPTIIVAATIPITLLVTISLMYWLGLGFDVITMSALTLAVGMIVDDAIVVSENCFSHLQKGKAPFQASIDGTVEIAGPDITGTFTTVAAFAPLVLIGGMAALFLRPFGLTISMALIISLLLSLTFIPLCFSRPGMIVPKETTLGSRFLKYLNKRLVRILGFSLAHKKMVLIPAGGVFLLSILLLFTLHPVRLLPPVDEGAILVEYTMPPGTSLEEADYMGDMLDKIALSLPDTACVYRRVGSPERGYQIEGANCGEIMIKLKPKGVRRHNVKKIIRTLKQAYNQVSGIVYLYHQPTQEKMDESFSGLPALFGVTVFGEDIGHLTQIANQVETILNKTPSISNVINHARDRYPETTIRLNYPQLAQYGLRAEDVLIGLRSAYYGQTATRIVTARQEIPILVKLGNAGQDLRHLPLQAGDKIIPLQAIADIDIKYMPANINHLNGQREVTLLADVGGNILSVVSALKQQFRQISLPPGYSIEITGQYKALLKATLQIGMVLLASLIIIYAIMLAEFHSWWQPLVILCAVPFAFVGAFFALAIFGQGIDVSVGMGLLTLAGVAVNNGIILIDFANRRQLVGISTRQALIEAASVRLRPILMTSLTTVFALLPTAIGLGVGSRVFQPFSITLIGGLLISTLVTLVLIPTIYAMIKVDTPKIWANI